MATFGNLNAGGNSVLAPPANSKAVSKFTLDRAGVVDTVSFTFAGQPAALVKAVIYDNTGSGGLPGALKGTSQERVNPGPGVAAFTFSPGISLAAGDYWLGLIANAQNTAGCFALTGGIAYNTNTYASGPSDPFGASPTIAAFRYPVNAGYTPTLTAGTYLGELRGGETASSFTTNILVVWKVIAAATGTVSALNLFVADSYASAKIKGVVYDATGTAGAPGALLGTTNELVGPVINGNVLTFPSPVALTSGTTYYIGILYDIAMTVYTRSSTNAGYFASRTYSSGPPSTFPSPTAYHNVGAFWATFAAVSAPTAPSSLAATVVGTSQIDLTWTASTGGGGVTGYSVERCDGVGCSTFSVVGTPTGTSFSDTGLTADTSYSYRVRANSPAGYSSYSSTVTAVTEAEPEAVPVLVRSVASTITFAGVVLTDVLSARGQVAADSGWPTCSVFVTAKPATGNEEDALSVVAGAGTNVTRFTGKVRRFKPSAFPKGIEIVAMGTLAYAAEWAPDTDLAYDPDTDTWVDVDPGDPLVGFFGVPDQELVQKALALVPGIVFTNGDIGGTGIVLGNEAPDAFLWRAGVSVWQYVQQLDQATLYRTYQAADGTIYRVQMIGHPSSTTTSFTLANGDILEGSSGSRNTEQTRNAAIVRGHDYGDGTGPVLGAAYGANDFQDDGSVAATRHPESFSSDLIEDGNDEDGTPWGLDGLDAQDIADAILNDVNKEFVEAYVRSWRDDEHGPGLTCLLDTLDRLAIGEKMWVMGYAWELDDGWTTTYRLSGGGLEQAYTPPPI